MVNLLWTLRFDKNRGGLMMVKLKLNKLKCKIELLEVLGC